jgi:cell wall assembly regulator SMI1
MTFDDHLAAVERWIAEHLPATHASLEPGLTDAALATVSDQLGTSLASTELAMLWAWHGGQRAESAGKAKTKPKPQSWLADSNSLYELMPIGDVVARKTRLDRDLTAGNLDTTTYTTKHAWSVHWIPFARAGRELLVLDLAGDFAGVAGQILRLDPSAHDRTIVAPTLRALLGHQIRMIQAGAIVVTAGKDGKPGKPSIVSRRWTSDPDHPRYPIRKRVERTARPPKPINHERALFDVLRQRMSGAEVEAALAAGSRLDLVDDSGRTPLHFAVQCPNTPPAEAMLRAGAAVDARDASGRTPLALAVELPLVRNVVDMVRMLIAAGADPDLADATGVTPRDRAAQRFNIESRAPVLAALTRPRP